MSANTSARVRELEAIARTLVTPEVRAELDAMRDDPLRDAERHAYLRSLADEHRQQAGCTLETSRRHIAKAAGPRATKWGGARPGAGAPRGNRNRWGARDAAIERADDLTDGGHNDPGA